MATAYSYQSAEMPDTSVPMVTSDDFTDGPGSSGKSIWSKIGRWFTGYDQEQNYANALAENNRRYEQAMIQNERDYQTWYDSTAVQRRVADIKAAGLNPWLALQSGGVSANGASGSAASPSGGSSAKREKSSGASALAMFLVSAAKLIASSL